MEFVSHFRFQSMSYEHTLTTLAARKKNYWKQISSENSSKLLSTFSHLKNSLRLLAEENTNCAMTTSASRLFMNLHQFVTHTNGTHSVEPNIWLNAWRCDCVSWLLLLRVRMRVSASQIKNRERKTAEMLQHKRNFRANEFLVKTEKWTASQKMRVTKLMWHTPNATVCRAVLFTIFYAFSFGWRAAAQCASHAINNTRTVRSFVRRRSLLFRQKKKNIIVWMCHTATGRTIQLYNKNVFIVYGHAVCQTSQQPELRQVDESKH